LIFNRYFVFRTAAAPAKVQKPDDNWSSFDEPSNTRNVAQPAAGGGWGEADEWPVEPAEGASGKGTFLVSTTFNSYIFLQSPVKMTLSERQAARRAQQEQQKATKPPTNPLRLGVRKIE